MIIAVTAWRFHEDTGFIRAVMDSYSDMCLDRGEELQVRIGDASGGDEIVWQWCKDNDVDYRRYVARRYPSGALMVGAGPERNRQMLTQEWYTEDPSGHGEKLWRPRKADLLIGFPEPGVRPKIPGSGSWGCIGEAFVQRIEILIPAYSEKED